MRVLWVVIRWLEKNVYDRMRGVQGEQIQRGANSHVGSTHSPMSLDENGTEKVLLAPLVLDELATWAEWQTDEEDEEAAAVVPKQQLASNACGEGQHCRGGADNKRRIASEPFVNPISCDSPLPQVHVPKCKRPTKMELLNNIAKHPFRKASNSAELLPMESLLAANHSNNKPEQKLAIVYPRPRSTTHQQPSSASPWKWRSEELLSRNTARKHIVSEKSSPREPMKGCSPGGSRWHSDDILPYHERRSHDCSRTTPVYSHDLIAEVSANDQSIALRLLDRDTFAENTDAVNAEEEDYVQTGQHFLYSNTHAFTSVTNKVGNGKQNIGDHYLDPSWNTRPAQEKSDTPLLSQDALVVEGGCAALSHRCWKCCREKAEYCHGLCLNCPGFWSIFFLIIDIPCAFCFC